MTMQDPVSDMLTRIRNALKARKEVVNIPYSKHKMAICQVLVDEGYVSSVKSEGEYPPEKQIVVTLKYHEGQPVITRLSRYSKPSIRRYADKSSMPNVPGFGAAIVSTSRGIMSHQLAKRSGVGGEVLCIVS